MVGGGGGNYNDLIENRTRDVPAVPQLTTLTRAPCLLYHRPTSRQLTARLCGLMFIPCIEEAASCKGHENVLTSPEASTK
jgi:hypothetical protein